MKALTLAILSALVLPSAQANGQKDDCDKITMYRPEAQDPVNAARVFGYELKNAGCLLRGKIKLSKEQYMYIQSFERGGKVTFEVVDFAKEPATSKICVVEQQAIRPTGPGPQLAIARFEYGTPVCSAESVAQ